MYDNCTASEVIVSDRDKLPSKFVLANSMCVLPAGVIVAGEAPGAGNETPLRSRREAPETKSAAVKSVDESKTVTKDAPLTVSVVASILAESKLNVRSNELAGIMGGVLDGPDVGPKASACK